MYVYIYIYTISIYFANTDRDRGISCYKTSCVSNATILHSLAACPRSQHDTFVWCNPVSQAPDATADHDSAQIQTETSTRGWKACAYA